MPTDALDWINAGVGAYGAYQASQGVDVPNASEMVQGGIQAWDENQPDIGRISQEQQDLQNQMRNRQIGSDLATLGSTGDAITQAHRAANPELYNAVQKASSMEVGPMQRLGGLEGIAAQSTEDAYFGPDKVQGDFGYQAAQLPGAGAPAPTQQAAGPSGGSLIDPYKSSLDQSMGRGGATGDTRSLQDQQLDAWRGSDDPRKRGLAGPSGQQPSAGAPAPTQQAAMPGQAANFAGSTQAELDAYAARPGASSARAPDPNAGRPGPGGVRQSTGPSGQQQSRLSGVRDNMEASGRYGQSQAPAQPTDPYSRRAVTADVRQGTAQTVGANPGTPVASIGGDRGYQANQVLGGLGSYQASQSQGDYGYGAAQSASDLSNQMTDRASERLSQWDQLSPRDERDINERARASFNDRGRVRDTSAVIREMQDNEQMKMARRGEAMGMGRSAEAVAQQDRLSNMGALNQASQFGQQAGLQQNLANMGAQNQAAQFGAGNQMQAGLANMGARNRAAEFGGQLNMQQSLANQAAQNQMAQFNTGQQLSRDLSNQAAQNQMTQFNVGTGAATDARNQAARNQMAQFNASNALNRDQFNAAAQNQAAQFGATQGLNVAQTNQGYENQARRDQSQARVNQSLANMGAQNQMTSQNLDLANQRDIYNNQLQQQDFLNQMNLNQMGVNNWQSLQQDPLAYISGRSGNTFMNPSDAMNLNNSALNAQMQNQQNVNDFWGNMAAGGLANIGG